MIPSTSTALLFATLVLQSLSGMGAPIKVTRALADSHQPGRREPQPIAADDLLKAREPAPAPAGAHPTAIAINRRFPRRIHYERYIRDLEARAPAPAPEPAPVEEEKPSVAARAVKVEAPKRRHARRSQRKEARSAPSTKNLAARRNSKVGGTLSKRLEAVPQPEEIVKRSEPEAVTAPVQKRKVVAKKRNVKARSVTKKRRATVTPAKKRSTSTLIKKDDINTAPNTVKRSDKSNSSTKRSVKAKNVKRNNKNSKRSPVAESSTPSEKQLRSLDVPSEHLEKRHYKLVKVDDSSSSGSGYKKGCKHNHKPGVQCCNCGCNSEMQTPPPSLSDLGLGDLVEVIEVPVPVPVDATTGIPTVPVDPDTGLPLVPVTIPPAASGAPVPPVGGTPLPPVGAPIPPVGGPGVPPPASASASASAAVPVVPTPTIGITDPNASASASASASGASASATAVVIPGGSSSSSSSSSSSGGLQGHTKPKKTKIGVMNPGASTPGAGTPPPPSRRELLKNSRRASGPGPHRRSRFARE